MNFKVVGVQALAALLLIHPGGVGNASSVNSNRFFVTERLPHFMISLEQRSLAQLRLNPRSYVTAKITGRERTYDDVGVHLKGQYGTFQGTDGKPSLTLNFDKFIKGQNFHGLDKFHLNNSVSDPSYTTELLCRELFRKAGLLAPRATHARVDINGRDAGFYVLMEGYDKTFLRQYFRNPDGNLYDSEFRHDITDPLKKSSGNGPDDHSDLKIFARAAEEFDHTQRLRELASLLDLNHFYSFLALELMTCHFDGYARSVNNYRVYHDPDSGKMIFMPTGMDQMFYNPQSSLFPTLTGVVARGVLGTSDGRKQYRQRCVVLFTNLFPKLSGRVEEVQQRIRPAIAQYGTNAVAHHDRAVANLQQRIAKRIEHLRRHLLLPEPNVLLLETGAEALLTNWLWSVEEGKAKMSANRLSDGGIVLQARLEPGEKLSRATWEARLLLSRGHYRVSFCVKADEAIFRGPDSPVAIKVWGGEDTGFESVRKDSQNTDLTRSFVINSKEPEDVLIQCQASSAEVPVTFEFSALILKRVE